MIKIVLPLMLISICAVNAQNFPIKAISLLGGGFLDPRTQKPVFVVGDVKFTQLSQNSPVTTKVNVTFSDPNGSIVSKPKSLHVHTFGISSLGQDPSSSCLSVGNVFSGGDFGTTTLRPVNGKVLTEFTNQGLDLFGVNSVIGRSVVLSDSGLRIACGVISFSSV